MEDKNNDNDDNNVFYTGFRQHAQETLLYYTLGEPGGELVPIVLNGLEDANTYAAVASVLPPVPHNQYIPLSARCPVYNFLKRNFNVDDIAICFGATYMRRVLCKRRSPRQRQSSYWCPHADGELCAPFPPRSEGDVISTIHYITCIMIADKLMGSNPFSAVKASAELVFRYLAPEDIHQIEAYLLKELQYTLGPIYPHRRLEN